MLIFSFYIMAKSYLRTINRNAPILATIFFAVFSGFGWVYFANSELEQNSSNVHFDNLVSSSIVSLSDLGSGQGIWLWLSLRPLTLGFSIFFVLVYLMNCKSLPRFSNIVVSSLLILTLSKIHLPEMVIFVVFIFVLSIFFPKSGLRTREMAISTIIGLVASAVLGLMYNILLGFDKLSTPYSHLLGLGILVSLTITFLKYPRRPKLPFRINPTLFACVAIFLYIFLLFHWFSTSDPSATLEIRRSGILPVPWEYYPVQLGITGVFGIIGIAIILKKYPGHPVAIFTVLFAISIIFGRALTFFNAIFLDTSYWEKRMIPFVFVSASILAPLTIFEVFGKFEQWRLRQTQGIMKYLRGLTNLLIVTFLSFLVLGGILSTLLTVEYRSIAATSLGLKENEIDLINSLNETHQYSTLLTSTDRSKYVTEFASLAYTVDRLRDQVWASLSPELPLKALTSVNGSSIIYLTEEDLDHITANEYSDGYVASNLLKTPPIKEGSDGASVIQLPKLVPVSSQSDTVLVLPDHYDKRNYYAYDILSIGGYNYTTATLSDVNSIGKASTVIVPDEYTAWKVMQYRQKYGLQYERIIVLNLRSDYGYLMDVDLRRTSLDSPKVISDNASKEWEVNTFGPGQTSIPKLIDNSTLKTSGDNSLAIDLGSGNFTSWEISKIIPKPINLTKFDFARLDWYGNGDGEWYTVEFSSGPYPVMSFRFQDLWQGWKTVVLPIHMSDDQETLFGVALKKTSTSQAGAFTSINKISLRPFSEFNSARQFYLDEFNFGTLMQSSRINGIDEGEKQISFPSTLSLYPIVPKSNYTLESSYDPGVPFILTGMHKGYNLLYLNLGPIIDKIISSSPESRQLYSLVGGILQQTQVKLPRAETINQDPFNIVAGGVAAFNKATLDGDMILDSSSAILNVERSPVQFNVDGRGFFLNNLSKLLPINIDNLTLNSNEGIIDGGSGYYSHVFLNQSTLNVKGHPAILELNFKDGSTRTLSGNEILVNLTKSNMLIRQPGFELVGEANFDNFYAFGELNDKVRKSGQDMKINGNVAFNIEFADKFSLTKGMRFEGEVANTQLVYPYDELGLLVENIFTVPYIRFLLTMLVIFLAVNYFFGSKGKQKAKSLVKSGSTNSV